MISFQRHYIGDGINAVTAPMGEQIYTVEGSARTLVVDTGTGIGSLKPFLDTFCTKPYLVVNTHGHPDHAGGNAEFDDVFMHPADADVYREMVTKEFRASDIRNIFGDKGQEFIDALQPYTENWRPIREGSMIDLGGRDIVIYRISGHTLGSIVLYDKETQTLFSGDACGIMDTWLYLPYSTTMEEYCKELMAFARRNLPIKRMLSGHTPNEDDGSLLPRKIALVQGILNGRIKGTPAKTFAGEGLRAELDGTSIIYNEKRLWL